MPRVKSASLMWFISICFLLIGCLSMRQDLWTNLAFANERDISEQEKMVIDEVRLYVDSLKEDDSLVEVEPNVWVKESNLNGIFIQGKRYYYRLSPHTSYDPVVQGEVTSDQIDILYQEDDEGFPLTIYTLKEQ